MVVTIFVVVVETCRGVVSGVSKNPDSTLLFSVLKLRPIVEKTVFVVGA